MNQLSYLTRHFGSFTAHNMIDTNSVPDKHRDIITKYVTSKPLKEPPALNLNISENMTLAKKYITRTYGIDSLWKLNDVMNSLTLYDRKMIHSMCKLHESYNTIYIESNSVTETQSPVQVLKINSKIEPKRCKAYKMDNTLCNAKVKDGCEFCGRHNKKPK